MELASSGKEGKKPAKKGIKGILIGVMSCAQALGALWCLQPVVGGFLFVNYSWDNWPKSLTSVRLAGKAAQSAAPPAEAVNGGSENTADYVKEIAGMLPIDKQFIDRDFPVGQTFEYEAKADDRTAANRMTNAEKKELDSSYFEVYNDFRRAAGGLAGSRVD